MNNKLNKNNNNNNNKGKLILKKKKSICHHYSFSNLRYDTLFFLNSEFPILVHSSGTNVFSKILNRT